MKQMKRLIAGLLFLVMLLQLLPSVTVFALTTEELIDSDFNAAGVWITEIYNNDVDRSKSADTRASSGYEEIQLYDSASDLMEFIEVCSTHDEPIKLNDMYGVYLDETLMPITDASGSSDITLNRGQVVVLWNYRTDITMPTEAEFRSALRIPDEAVVLYASFGSNWPAASGTFAIKSKASGETVSSFTATRDVHTKDGMSVELKMPFMKSSAMEVYRELTLPTAGRIFSKQLNGLIVAKTDGFDGKGVYITELHPNDINRSSTYGTASDVMECIEITNTTDSEINLNSDYKVTFTVKEGFRKVLQLYKYSSSASGHVGSSSSCVVPAGGTAVLWCYRYSTLTDYTSYPTLSQFRSAYGISSDTPVYIFTNQNGLTNDLRSLEVFQAKSDGGLGELVSRYSYLGNADCADGLSAQLQINPEGPEMLLNTANAAASMGSVDAAQLAYTLDDGTAMELRLYDGCTVPESIMQGEDLRVYFYYNAPGLSRTNSATYYRLDGTGDWILLSEGGIRVPNRYEVVISGAELFDHDYVEFYVVKSNYYRDTVRGIYKVNIKKLNDIDGIRTNISDGEEVSGTVSITANDGSASNSSTKIYIDGTKQTTAPMLEDGGYYTYVVDGIDSYFRTAITTNKNVLITHIGKWAYQSLKAQVKHIDSSYFTYKSSTDSYTVVLRFWAGTYGTPTTETLFPDANREDFTVTNLKLKLANGNSYLPSKIGPSSYNGVDTSVKTDLNTAFDTVHYIGDSTGKCPYMDVTFTVPASEVTAVGVQLDTTGLSDGAHTLKVTNGTSTKEVTFIVDNTAPVIDLGVANGSSLTKNITLNPQITETNHLSEFVTYLDGEQITTPYETTAYALGEGEHTLLTYAKDAAGNETTAEAVFVVDDISMTVSEAGVRDITHSDAKLYLTAQSDAAAQATFYKAEKIAAANIAADTVSGIQPHIQYTIAVDNANAGDHIVVNWNGSASDVDNTHALKMFVANTVTGAWEQIGTADANGFIQDASFPVEDHVAGGKATVIVQCTADSALPDLDTSTDGKTGNNAAWDGTSAPADYDFSFAWISDTQGYVQRYQSHFLNMNNWIVDNAEAWKIKYVMHTGDIVDDWDTIYQWENADEAMKIFDDAGMPYGVLAGNHDVASGLDLRENYYAYFGEDRVKDQPVFGGSYKDNLGHYDLVSENGQDFIIVYMSWNIYQEEIDWMNEVLAKYSDRKAILCFHAYTHVRESVDGLLDYYGVLVRDHVVAKNPNVFAVLNGHYSGSTYQTVRFDDNGDGKLDRTVYQICTDYQSVEKGGLEYIKFLYFDLDNNKVFVNAYSPYMDDYNYFDTAGADDLSALAKASSTGVVSNTDIDSLILSVDFSTEEQTVLAESISADLYTDEVLGTADVDFITGAAEVKLTGLAAKTSYNWYATVENENTGYLRTEIYEFTTAEAPIHNYESVVTAPGCAEDGFTTHTCTICGDSYVDHIVPAVGHSWTAGVCGNCGSVCGHSYENGKCTICGMEEPAADPVITPKYPSLSFEGEIFINVYFTMDNCENVAEMGLLTSKDSCVDEADTKVPGYDYAESTGLYSVRTAGISAKNLVDTIYFRVYAKLVDGRYVYSDTYHYSALEYAKDRLANSTSTKMKALCVAMLNYGAAAQTHMGYRADALVNVSLSADQLSLVEAYRSDMVSELVGVESARIGAFAYNSAGYSSRYPSVSFEGAFSINYYFTPSKTVDGSMTLYYWNANDYAAADVLTVDNATGSMVMNYNGVSYEGTVSGISAKDIDQTVFVAGVYTSGGVSYATGVLPYSLGAYCLDRIANGSGTMKALAEATAVYGYYAKQYFS